ncbi:MAG: autotransporter-associated beta strand repeat-containing protein [Akkermansiaceae bacterium]|nr:autotransporter-associated beta strand repeat-containing protein [Akkermansiaceae bacterium]
MKKPNNNILKHSLPAPILTALFLPAGLLCSGIAQAATETWDGGHGSANAWYANLNWADDTAPGDGDDLVFTGTTRLNHLAYGNFSGTGDAQIGSITFDAAAGAFVIGDAGGGTYRMFGDITNNSTNLQTLNFAIQLDANISADTAAGDITLGGVISGSQFIANDGDGTLLLESANTHTGGTRVGFDNNSQNSATRVVKVTDSGALGTGKLEFFKSGTFELGSDALTITNNVFSGNYSADGNDKIIKLDLAGTNSGTMSGNIDTRGTHAGHFQVDVGSADTLTLSGNISNGAGGGSGITKIGDGTLLLSGTNTYNGKTTVDAGTLKLSGGDAIEDIRDVTVNAGGTLDLNGSSETINRLTGSGTIDNSAGNGTLVVGGNNSSSQFDGTLTDSVGTLKLRQAGTGTLTLTGSSTYSGGTDIYAGTVVANHSAALGTGEIYMGVTAGVTQTLAIGADGVNIANNFFLQNSNSTHEIKFDVAGSNASTLSGNMTNQVDNAGNLDFIVGADDTLTLSGNLSSGSAGNSGLDKDGAGTLVLSGSNAYKGATRVNDGTLSLATGYTHTGTGAFTVAGGTLNIADGVNLSNAMTIGLDGVISPGNSPGTASTGAQTWNDGGSYLWEINDSDGSKGLSGGGTNGWDWLDITGELDLTNLTAGGFTIDITSLTTANDSGLAAGFDYSGLAYGDPFGTTFIIASADTISGFNASLFTLDDSAFVNGKLDWSIIESGTDLMLTAVFVPEPSSTALLGLGGLALMLRRKR